MSLTREQAEALAVVRQDWERKNRPQSVTFNVPGIPVPQGSMKGYRVGNHVKITSDNAKLRPWRAVVADQAKQAWGDQMPLAGAVRLTLEFRMPVPKSAPKRRRLEAVKRPDLDKLARAVLDALTGIVFADDSQVVRLFLDKRLAYDQPPGLTATVEWATEE